MIWRLALLLLIVACRSGDQPQRAGIISLDFCADLHVLQLADESAIVALSPDARSDFAYLREEAAGFPSVRPEIEAVLSSGAATVVRSYGGDARMIARLEAAGLEVINIGYPGTLEEVAANTERLAKLLGSERHVPALPDLVPPSGKTALYLTPSGTTTGPGSLMHELLVRGGFENAEERPGWPTLPLENLIMQSPDHLVKGFFDSELQYEGWWGTMRHPLAEGLLTELPSTELSARLISCPAWPLFEAVARLQEASR